MAVTFVCGLLMRSAVWRVGPRLDLQARDGILLVGLVWTLLPLFASLPLLAYFNDTAMPTMAWKSSTNGMSITQWP